MDGDTPVNWDQFSTVAKWVFVFICWGIADLLTILTIIVGKLLVWLVSN